MHYEDLHDVTIVSHSYGGVVAAGAVDRMPGRFARAVYFDALVPRDGASVVDLLPDEYQPYFISRITADGRIPLADDSLMRWGLDSDEDLAWVRPRLTDQPAATFTDKLALSRPVESAGPRAHIHLCHGEADSGSYRISGAECSIDDSLGLPGNRRAA